MIRPPPRPPLFPYTTLFRSAAMALGGAGVPLPDSVDTRFGLGLEWFAINLLVLALVFVPLERALPHRREQRVFRPEWTTDRKSTRLNSSHSQISYAVFCLQK